MRVIIRDDDTCGFTTPAELEEVYGRYWEDGIPISLSVTPFRIPGGTGEFNEDMHWGIPKRLWGSRKALPIEENKELVSFLRENIRKGMIDIALHGYNHITLPEDYRFPPELERIPQIVGREYLYGRNLAEKTRLGKEYLERLLNMNVTTFVPPGNAISKRGLKAITENKLNLIGVPPLWRVRSRPIRLENYVNFILVKIWRASNGGTKYPYVLRFSDHKEIYFYTLGPDTILSDILFHLENVYRAEGVFILATHYHAFNRRVKSGETIKVAFDKIMNHIRRKQNVQFITYRDLWE